MQSKKCIGHWPDVPNHQGTEEFAQVAKKNWKYFVTVWHSSCDNKLKIIFRLWAVVAFGWLFPRMRGFWENIQQFIPHLRFFFSFFKVETSLHKLNPLFRPGSVGSSGLASWDDCDRVFPFYHESGALTNKLSRLWAVCYSLTSQSYLNVPFFLCSWWEILRSSTNWLYCHCCDSSTRISLCGGGFVIRQMRRTNLRRPKALMIFKNSSKNRAKLSFVFRHF